MIQRIQTAYLLFACLALLSGAIVGALDMIHPAEAPQDWATPVWIYVFIALMGLAAVYSAVNIFRFRRRPAQARGVKMTMGLIVVAFVAFLVAIVGDDDGVLPIGLLSSPVVGLLFSILARRAILHDEKLVRDADRIR